MKKQIFTLFICCGLVGCLACSKKTDDSVPKSDETIVPETVIPDKASDNANSGAENADKLNVVSHDTEKKVDNMTFILKTQTYGIEKIDARLSQAVNALVASEIGEFNDVFGADKDASMTVTVCQETVRANKKGVDVVFKIDRNVSGTAHPSGDVQTFMFNPETGEEVSATLDSLGIDRDKLVARCVEVITPLLEGVDDAKTIVEDALKDNAFEHLVRTDKGFRVFFAPEEIVGPYRELIEVDFE